MSEETEVGPYLNDRKRTEEMRKEEAGREEREKEQRRIMTNGDGKIAEIFPTTRRAARERWLCPHTTLGERGGHRRRRKRGNLTNWTQVETVVAEAGGLRLSKGVTFCSILTLSVFVPLNGRS